MIDRQKRVVRVLERYGFPGDAALFTRMLSAHTKLQREHETAAADIGRLRSENDALRTRMRTITRSMN